MINISNIDWRQALTACLWKHEYEKAKWTYDSRGLFSKLIALLRGLKPIDPVPGFDSEKLAGVYVRKFNQEHGFGRRTQINETDTIHVIVRFQNEDRLPVITITYYEDGTAYVEKEKVLFDGWTKKCPIPYPYSEIGIYGVPRRPKVDIVGKMKKRYDDALRELSTSVFAAMSEGGVTTSSRRRAVDSWNDVD